MFGEGSNKLLLPTQSIYNLLCVCCYIMYACYKINMFKPTSDRGTNVHTQIKPFARQHSCVLEYFEPCLLYCKSFCMNMYYI